MFNPYSKNIIFFDTEFSSLDPRKGEILSIGIVKLGKGELYLELKHDGPVDPWPRDNILPTLRDKKVSRRRAATLIKQFIGKSKPYAVAYVNQFDMAYFYKLIPQSESPFHWLPVDFASVLFAHGFDPESMTASKTALYEKLGIDHAKYQKHNALDDARLLKEAYLKMSMAKRKNNKNSKS